MEVIWRIRATNGLRKTFDWYKDSMGINAANKFRQSIFKVTLQLARNPLMGVVEPELSLTQRCVRSVISKKYKVIYYLEDDIVYIQYIWCCIQDKSSLLSLDNKSEKKIKK